MCHNFLLFVCNCHKLVDYTINWLFDLDVNVSDCLDFDYFFLNNRDLNLSLNLFYDDLLNLFLNYFLYDLGHLDNLLDHSWNDNNSFDNFLYFHNFRYLNHLFNYLLDFNTNFLYLLNISWNLYNFLFNISYGFGDLNVMIYNFLDFNKLGLVNDHGITKINFLNHSIFHPLNDWLFNDLLHFFYYLLDDWNLDDFLDFNRNLPDNLNDFLNNNFHRLYNLLSNKFFFNYLNFFNFHLFNNDLDNLLNYLRYLHDTLNCFNHRHDFLYNTIDWLVDGFNVVAHF